MPQCKTHCPKFGQLPVKIKSLILHGKDNFATTVNRLLVLELFHLSNIVFIFVFGETLNVPFSAMCMYLI